MVPGGHWFLKKTWSRKSRVRLPLSTQMLPTVGCPRIYSIVYIKEDGYKL